MKNEFITDEFYCCPVCGIVSETPVHSDCDRRESHDDYSGPYRRFTDALNEHTDQLNETAEKAKEMARDAFSGAIVGLMLTIFALLVLLTDGPVWK